MATPWKVPALWRGQAVVCLASGPSLSVDDVDRIAGRARVVAVNDSFRIAPGADLLYACDAKWWHHQANRDALSFAGLKVTCDDSVVFPQVHLLTKTGATGFDPEPGNVRHGSNSGYQAIHLAVQLGGNPILLLGYDCGVAPDGKSHFFGDHPPELQRASPFSDFIEKYRTLPPELPAGVEVINCSRETAIDAFPRGHIEQALGYAAARRMAANG